MSVSKIIGLSCCLLFACRLQADELSSLIDQALRHPRVSAAEQDVTAAQARAAQASALPDPAVKYFFMGEMIETRLGPQEQMWEVEQDIPYPGKLFNQRSMARADAQAAQARLEAVRRDIIFQVKAASYDLWSVRQRRELMRLKIELSDQLTQSAAAGYASGISEQKDALEASSLAAVNARDEIRLQREEETIRAELQSLLNAAKSPEDVWSPGELPPDVPLDALLQRIVESPSVTEAGAMTRRAESAWTQAKLANRPDFKIGFQYVGIGHDNMGVDPDEGRDAWAIPLTVTIPLWQGRVRAGIREGKNNLQAAHDRYDQIELETVLDLKKAYYAFRSQKETVELYRDRLIPQAQMREASEKAAYESGEGDISSWIAARMDLLDWTMMSVEAQANMFKRYAEMEKIVGKTE